MDGRCDSPLFCAGSGQTPNGLSGFLLLQGKVATWASCSEAANEHQSVCSIPMYDFGTQGLRGPITSLQKLQRAGQTLFLAAERTVADR